MLILGTQAVFTVCWVYPKKSDSFTIDKIIMIFSVNNHKVFDRGVNYFYGVSCKK